MPTKSKDIVATKNSDINFCNVFAGGIGSSDDIFSRVLPQGFLYAQLRIIVLVGDDYVFVARNLDFLENPCDFGWRLASNIDFELVAAADLDHDGFQVGSVDPRFHWKKKFDQTFEKISTKMIDGWNYEQYLCLTM